MKNIFLLVCLLTACSHFVFSQPGAFSPVPKTIIGIISVKQPLLLIGHLETNINSLIIRPENLQILARYTDSLALVPFGDKGRQGIVIAKLKEPVPLFRLPEVLDYFKVPAENRHLKVLVDNRLINPELFLADIRLIRKIEVTQQAVTSFMRYSWQADELFLNILTAQE